MASVRHVEWYGGYEDGGEKSQVRKNCDNPRAWKEAGKEPGELQGGWVMVDRAAEASMVPH